MDQLIFGAAYYEEYLPYDRLERDMEMMAGAGVNTIRIAESTWSVEEPRPGEYDFSHVDRVLDAAGRHGIQVIIGTPTYAIPRWLAEMDPTVLVENERGRASFGPRQNMDITNPTYRKYAEGIIRALISHTAPHSAVAGFQLDNETKHFGTASPAVLARFRRWMAERYGTVEAMNAALGLNYWSNSVTSFDSLPDPRGTVNGSYAGEFALFQRTLVEEFLQWQSEIVREYLRPGQFVTHNFDFAWRGYSYGVQPDVDHFRAAKALTLAGLDVYCNTQDLLTGKEIAFAGDLVRSLKHDNYLVLESVAQGFPQWLPYPGQLRLMAYANIASGARGVMYWHWSSIHNAMESYWKGLLSHDFQPNPTYEEAASIGRELKALSPKLAGLRKKNRIALLVSCEALHALRHFPTDEGLEYNDIVRWTYDALYELNLECDVIYAQEEDWSGYDLLVIPSLYTADDALIRRVRAFTEAGGTVFATFRSFFADERVKIRCESQPYGLTDMFGLHYSQFSRPVNVTVDGVEASHWMELLIPASAGTVASYRHKYWGTYAAVTRNAYGSGHAWYLGTMLPPEKLKEYLLMAAGDAGIAPPPFRWPIVLREAAGPNGERLRFILNFSDQPSEIVSPWDGVELRTGQTVKAGGILAVEDWGVRIVESAP